MKTRMSLLVQTGLMVVIVITAGCKKEKQDVVISPVAVVPKTVYSGDRNIEINASFTRGSGVDSKVDYQWSWASVPPGSDQPRIENPRASRTYIERMPEPGIYQLRLQVSETSGPVSTADFRIEVLPDTLGNYPAKANAGHEKSVYWPVNWVILDGCGSEFLNPPGRRLSYHWTQLAAPAGSTSVQIASPANCWTNINGLTVDGEYVFTLAVTNEAGSVALDTVVVTVLPDTLKGKSMEFTGKWSDRLKYLNAAWGVDVGIFIPSPVFEGRSKNLEIRVWDDQRQQWHDPGLYPWEIYTDEWEGDYTYYLVIFPVPNADPSTYYQLVDKEAKIQVTFK